MQKSVQVKVPSVGVCHINASFNNTIVTIADPAGNSLFWSTCGEKGFKGARKSTPFAAQVAAAEVAQLAFDAGMRSIAVEVKRAWSRS
jgi:small subunit ribosomal protein S11